MSGSAWECMKEVSAAFHQHHQFWGPCAASELNEMVGVHTSPCTYLPFRFPTELHLSRLGLSAYKAFYLQHNTNQIRGYGRELCSCVVISSSVL